MSRIKSGCAVGNRAYGGESLRGWKPRLRGLVVGALCKRACWDARLETAPTGFIGVGALCKRACWDARLETAPTVFVGVGARCKRAFWVCAVGNRAYSRSL